MFVDSRLRPYRFVVTSSDAGAPPLTLRLLGSPELVAGDGRIVQAVLAGPKRLALLAYLVLENPGGFARRDTLLALLWPDATLDKARQALRSMLYVLRSELGEGVIIARGADEVGVSLAALCCDVVEFQKACADGRLGDAAARYRGDLLTGFYVSEAPEFERWLEEKRAMLRRHAVETLWSLADRHARNGDRLSAESRAHEAAALNPGDELSVRRLMLMLASLGDTGGALAAYHAYATMLAADYDATPSPEIVAVAVRIRAGEHFVAISAPVLDPRRAERPPRDAHGSNGPRRSSPNTLLRMRAEAGKRAFSSPRGLLASGTLLLLAASGVLLFRTQPKTAAAAETKDRIAVLPFRVFGRPELSVLAAGMVDMIAPLMTGDGTPLAIDPRRVLEVASAPDHPGDSAVARRLGARFIVTGSVTESSSRLTVASLVTEAATGRIVARAHVQGSRDSLTAIVEEVTARLLLEAIPSSGHVATRNKSAPRFAAVSAYLAGRAAYRRGTYEVARDDYERALLIDSGFVMPAFALAELSGYLPSDPHEAVLLGKRLAWRNRHQLVDRDRAYLAALLGPRYPSPTPPGEMAAAREHAVELNSARADAWFLLGEHYLHAGAFLGDSATNRAASAFERALSVDSLYAAPLEGAMELAFLRGLSSEGLTLGRRYLQLHASADIADYVRWRVALESDDASAVAAERSRFREYRRASLTRVAAAVQTPRAPIVDAELAAHALVDNAATVRERVSGYFAVRDVSLIAGKPSVSTKYTLLIARDALTPTERRDALFGLVMDADVAGGDPAIADSLRREFSHTSPAELRLLDDGSRWPMRNVCFMLHADLSRGDTSAARRDIAELRARSSDAIASRALLDQQRARAELAGTCRTLGAIALSQAADPRNEAAHGELLALEARSGSSPVMHGWINLWLAHLLEDSGDPSAARRLVAQRLFTENSHVLPGYQTYIYDEARLAAAVHDCTSARRSIHQLLVLQANADDRLKERNRALATVIGRCTALQRG